MTDQELFERLKREGECWHEWEMAADIPICHHCRRECEPANFNPDFSTPDGMAWAKERAREHEWWREYLLWSGFCPLGGFESIKELDAILKKYDSVEALKEYLSEETTP